MITMENNQDDPFLDKRSLYEKTLKEYNAIIVNSFSIKDFREYNEILFSAHSCAIEGNSFSVDDTRALKEKGISLKLHDKSLAEAFEILDHFEAIKYLNENKSSPLTEELVKETHAILTKNTIGFKGHTPGEYSKTQMGAGDTIFRDTEKAIKTMPGFLESINSEMEKNRMHPIELSAIFHQMFIYKHPFPDGNGRLGRLLSNFILEKKNHQNVIILNEDRNNYIAALKASDKMNSNLPIIAYFYDTSIKRMKHEIAQKKNLSKNYKLGLTKENANHIEIAKEFHQNNNYKGKIENITAYGQNNPLVAAFEKETGVKLTVDDLQEIDNIISKDNDRGYGY